MIWYQWDKATDVVTKRDTDLLEFARWYDTADRQVAEDFMPDGTRISTVCLGINTSFFGGSPPLIFETMIFGGPLDLERERYVMPEQARQGHRRTINRVLDAARRIAATN